MKSDFQWTAKAEHSFKQLKQRIAELPMLTAPRPKEDLIIHALQGPELNYTPIEKLVLALVNAARRLRSVLLGEHDITYRIRTSIRGQILADFIVEKPEENNPEENDTVLEELPKPWTLFMDGSSCIDGSRAGLILTSPKGMEFTTTDIIANGDPEPPSKCGFPSGGQPDQRIIRCKRRKHDPVPGEKAKALISRFIGFSIKQVPRSENKKVDALRPLQANYVIKKIHEGSCSTYSRPRSVVAKAIRSGYHWPPMHQDARNVIQKCQDCQAHRTVPRNPQKQLIPITSPWTFYMCGIDIAGPFPKGPGKIKFLIVTINYFRK
ncbi:reverse transcriptase domain-containing protein [Tanacetum coccineum]